MKTKQVYVPRITDRIQRGHFEGSLQSIKDSVDELINKYGPDASIEFSQECEPYSYEHDPTIIVCDISYTPKAKTQKWVVSSCGTPMALCDSRKEAKKKAEEYNWANTNITGPFEV